MPDKSPINIDIGASAKAEIKAEVPSSSVGRLVDALTDAIRPFTERRGLRADLIRLQREDVLIQIATKAKARLEIEQDEPAAIPNRVLLPLLERASWTDPADTTLIEAWSELLASASRKPDPNHGILVDVLSKLDAAHVEFLDWISKCGTSGSYQDAHLEYSAQQIQSEIYSLRLEQKPAVSRYKSVANKIAKKIADLMNNEGVYADDGSVQIIGDDAWIDAPIATLRPYDPKTYDLIGGLVSLNLIAEVMLQPIPLFDGCDAWIHYFYVTKFGSDFIDACTSRAAKS